MFGFRKFEGKCEKKTIKKKSRRKKSESKLLELGNSNSI